MPVNPTYPGVYVEELPSGVHTITPVATSIAAFVGTFGQGPLNAPLLLLSPQDFERNYGGLDRSSATSYAVQQFFSNGGQQCWIVRVADTDGDPTASPAVPGAAAATAQLTKDSSAVLNATAGRQVMGSPVPDPGSWGNFLRLQVDPLTTDPTTLFNLTVSEVQVDGDRTTVVQSERYLNLVNKAGEVNDVVAVVNDASLLVQLDRKGISTPDLPDPNGTLGAALKVGFDSAPNEGDRLDITLTGTAPALTLNVSVTFTYGSALVQLKTSTAQSGTGTTLNFTPSTALSAIATGALVSGTGIAAGSTVASINVSTGAVTLSQATTSAVAKDATISFASIISYLGLRPFLEAAIRSAAVDATIPNGLKPLLANATVDLIGANTTASPARFLVRLGATARPYDPTMRITFANAAATATAVKLTSAGVLAGQQQTPLANGNDGPQPAAGTNFRPVKEKFFAGTIGAKSGMYALENVDLFNILCIPEATTLSASDMQALYAEAETYVEGRRAMLIVDIPDSVSRIDLMQNWLVGNDSLRNANAAVYFPRTNVPDPLNQNRPRSIPSSGTIAGLWARTDVQRGVWKAPAGTAAQLQNVGSLTYAMTDQENGVLNPLGVNCLRTFPVYSTICWGARTLEGADLLASDWKYVPVRRLTLFLEESLYRGTKWAVFEPNDEPLWSQIRLNVGSFMQDLFRQGAFQGSTPQAAYYVKCDSDTTTQSDIDHGVVNIEVGFAPLKPAEFVILQIRQIAPGTTT